MILVLAHTCNIKIKPEKSRNELAGTERIGYSGANLWYVGGMEDVHGREYGLVFRARPLFYNEDDVLLSSRYRTTRRLPGVALNIARRADEQYYVGHKQNGLLPRI